MESSNQTLQCLEIAQKQLSTAFSNMMLEFTDTRIFDNLCVSIAKLGETKIDMEYICNKGKDAYLKELMKHKWKMGEAK